MSVLFVGDVLTLFWYCFGFSFDNNPVLWWFCLDLIAIISP